MTRLQELRDEISALKAKLLRIEDRCSCGSVKALEGDSQPSSVQMAGDGGAAQQSAAVGSSPPSAVRSGEAANSAEMGRGQSQVDSSTRQVDVEEGQWFWRGSSRVWRRISQDRRGSWQLAKGRKSGRIAASGSMPLSTSNRFDVLQDEEPERGSVRCLVVGDSRVRPLGRVFCGREDRCVTRPGARVADLVPVVESEVRQSNPRAVVIQVGVNNIGPKRSEELVEQYKALLAKLQESRKPVVVTGILPRAGATQEWYSRALAVNERVSVVCQAMGFQFVDKWEVFFGRSDLYRPDGLHLSDEGARVLGAAYQHALQGNL